MSAGRSASKQKSEPRGNPFEMPSNETYTKSRAYFDQRKDRNSSNSQVRSAFQVGRDTLDGPGPLLKRGRERQSNGSKSLVVNRERQREREKKSEGEGRSNFGFSDSRNQYSLSHFTSGVPSGSNITRPQRALKMRQESPSPNDSSRDASTQDVPQYRNASADPGKIISSSLSPSTIQTRSATRKSQGRDEPIVLDDSDEEKEERPTREKSPPSQSSESHIDVPDTNGENHKSYNSLSRSPEESITTSGDVEMEESRFTSRQDEDVEVKVNEHSQSNDDVQNLNFKSPERERNRLLRQDASLSPEIPQINPKSFHVAQPQDASRSRIADRMKGKDGQTRPLIDPRLKAKNKIHDQSLFNSGLNARSNTSSRHEKSTKVMLQRIAFDRNGFIGPEHNPAIDFSSFPKAFEIRWDGDGGGIECQNVVIDYNDCESLRASKESLSASKEPYRLLQIDLLDDSRTALHLEERLEAVKGIGAVHGSKRVILEASHGGSQEEQNWINFRRKLTMLRSRPLKDLNESESRKIKALHKDLDPLIPAREKQNLSSSSATNGSRPKARPSVSNGSNLFAPTPLENRQRTSDARGLRPREEQGAHAQDGKNSGIQPRPLLKRSKSPSPKKVLDPNKRLLNYPFRVTSGGSVAILQSDFDRLDPGEFLNDTMIDFGLKYLLEQIRERDPDLHKDIFVFSSFFYNRINEKKKDRSVGYELVKKWTRKAELFTKKYIVVPINENLHWYLAIIVNPLFAIPEEIRNGGNRGTEVEADSKYTSAMSSPTSGTEKMNVDDITHDSDLFAGEVSAQHQHIPEIDEDGDRHMIPVEDKRTSLEGNRINDISDAISNDGGGSLVGGGDKRKGIPFEPGESFSPAEEETSKRTRRVITSRIVEPSSSSEEIGTSSFYGKDANAKSSETIPRPSPELRRSARSAGLVSPVINYDILSSRRSSINLSQDLSETWRKQLNEGATVCVFDSLQQKHSPVKTAMKHYLAYEYADKYGLNEQIDFKSIELNMIDVTMPRQPNWADCGLYLLHAFERFFSDPKAFKDDVIPARNEHHLAWKSEQALDLRQSWKAIIERLSVEYQEERQKREQELQEKRAKRKEEDEEESLPATEEGIDDERQEVTGDAEEAGPDSVELLEKLRSSDADQHDGLSNRLL